MRKQFSSQRHEWIVRFVREIAKWLIESCTVRMCCKCYSPILTLKGNICLLEMTIGRLMIALLLVHLCSANMVPPCKAREFTKHKQVIIWPFAQRGWGGRGGRGRSVHRRAVDLWAHGAPLAPCRGADDRPDCVFFLIARALRAASTGAVSVGLVYHTLKNYKLCHLDTWMGR